MKHSITAVRTLLLASSLFAFGSASDLHAATYTVTGTIRTPAGGSAAANNIPVKYIRVIVRDEDLVFDDTVATVHTATNGTFSATWTDNIEAPDVYINIEYVGTAIDGREIRVAHDATPGTTILDENVEGVVHADIPAGTLALGVLRTSSTAANIISHLGDSLRYVRSQYAAWAMPNNLLVRARTTNGASFVSGDGSHMSISQEDYNSPGSGNAAYSDIHHESFHWMAYRAYGNRWPNFNCNPGSHSSNLESCEGFAMQEGSAQYYGTQSAAAIGLVDQKTGIPTATDWRGSDGTGFNANGEIVEGALERTWRLNANNPGQFRVLLADSPDSIREFRDGYSTREGATSANMITFLNNAALNGIVYTRSKIDTFPETAPPNVAPAPDGNFKVIDDIAFVRGKVKPTITSLTNAELRLAANSAQLAPDQKTLGYKKAVAGLADASIAGFTFLPMVAFASPLDWDTKTLADDDYDVIIRSRNANTWTDTFNPDFNGDGTASVNTTEKWFKTLKVWYSREATPASDDKGKVIVDNKAPTVTNMKPQ